VSGNFTYELRDFAGLFSNRNEFAIQTVILISMLLGLVQGHNALKSLIVTLSFVMIIASLSTKAFLIFFFVLFFPPYLKASASRKVAVALLATLALSTAYFATPNIQERITRFTMVVTAPEELKQSESAFLRVWLTVEGLRIIASKPLTGVGVDNSRMVLVPPVRQLAGTEEGLYSHNNYIELALNAGVPGALLFYLPIMYVYFKLKRSHPYWAALKAFIFLYALLGIAMVQYNNFISIILYCLIIFLFIYYKERFAPETHPLHRQHTPANRAYESVIEPHPAPGSRTV
jgi:hypothetical protein